MLVLNQTVSRPDIQRFIPSGALGDRVVRLIRRLTLGGPNSYFPLGADSLEIFSRGRSVLGDALFRRTEKADIVNFHWTFGMFEYDVLARPGRYVWTLHDMHPFTGGCHFDAGCGRFQAACGSCPQLGSHSDRDPSRQMWDRRSTALASLPAERMTIVAPSRWLADAARRSSLFGRFRVEVIPYGLDTDTFRPRDHRAAREVLDIPQDARVVVFVADGLMNRRKGFQLLIDALKPLRDVPNLWLLAIGRGDGLEALPLPYRQIRFLDDDRLLSALYGAADLFVIPSIQDNLPNTALEALSCGLPIVGFEVGGIPDIVREGENGLLAPDGDTARMSAAIREILVNADRRQRMKTAARSIAVSEFALDTQAARYESLYRSILRDRVASPEDGRSAEHLPSANGLGTPSILAR